MTTDHDIFLDRLGEYVAGVLSSDERAACEAHLAVCPGCAALLAETAASDTALLAAFAAARPDADLEKRLIQSFQESTMARRPLVHPFAKRLSLGIAAAMMLGATGLAANYVVSRNALHPFAPQMFALGRARELANREPLAPGAFEAGDHSRSIQTAADAAKAPVPPAEDWADISKSRARETRTLYGRAWDDVGKDREEGQAVGFGDRHAEWGSTPSTPVGADDLSDKSGEDVFALKSKLRPEEKAAAEHLDQATNRLTKGEAGAGGLTKVGSGTLTVTTDDSYRGVLTDGGAPLAVRKAPAALAPGGGPSARPTDTSDLTAALPVSGPGHTTDVEGRPLVVGATGGSALGSNTVTFSTTGSMTGSGSLTGTSTFDGGISNGSDTIKGDVTLAYDGSGPDGKRTGEGGGFGGGGGQRGGSGDAPAAAPNKYFQPGSDFQKEVSQLGAEGGKDTNDGKHTIVAEASIPSKATPGLKGTASGADYDKLDDASETTTHSEEGTRVAAGPNAPSAPPPPSIPASPGTPPAPPPPSPNLVAERKIIRTGTMEVEVRSFDDAFATITSVVTEEGGFVSSTTSDKGANGKLQGTMTLRVPPEHLDRLVDKLRALGDIKSRQISAADVTKQYTDVESELRALRAMEQRLLDIIKNGKGEVKDLLEAERQLGDYRVRIEKLEGEIRYYNNLVSMSTLTITLYEKDIKAPASVYETENVNASIETEEVDARYAEARKAIDDAKGRIVESELTKHEAGQLAARIVCDVPPDRADFLTAQLKQLGNVVRLEANRRQVNDSGVAAPSDKPIANTKIEQRDTRFLITMYNLANIAPRQTTVMTIAVKDVADAYRTILDRVRQTPPPPPPANGAAAAPEVKAQPAGVIVNSNMQGQRPDQMVADIRADVRSTEAAVILQALRGSGEVINSTLTENPDTANVTPAKTGFQIHLVPLAAVAPREATSLIVAAPKVAEAYNGILAAVQSIDTAGSATVRIIRSQLNQNDARNVTALLEFQVPRTSMPLIDKALSDGGVDVLSRNTVRSTDTVNTVDSKVGYQISIASVGSLAPRETTTMLVAATSVASAYNSLLAAVQGIDTAGAMTVRVVQSQLNQADARNVSGFLDIQVPRNDRDLIERTLAEAGVDVISRNVQRSTDTTSTVDSKLGYQITFANADSLAPRRTVVLGLEATDVEKAMLKVRDAENAVKSEGAVKPREVAYSVLQDSSGQDLGHIIMELPSGAEANDVVRAVQSLGDVKVNQITDNPQLAESKFARDRIDVTIKARPTLVAADEGMSSTARSAIKAAAAVFFWALYFVILGVLVVVPLAVFGRMVMWLWRRRKPAAAAAPAGPAAPAGTP